MISIREFREGDRDWLVEQTQPFGGPEVVSGGFLHRLKDYPGIIAESNGERAGHVFYRAGPVRWELIAIRSFIKRSGIGSALLEHIEDTARKSGAEQMRLSVTNDNFPAMRFCQLRGYRFRQLIPGAFLESKKLKGIARDEPVLGLYGIEIRDEIILNKDL